MRPTLVVFVQDEDAISQQHHYLLKIIFKKHFTSRKWTDSISHPLTLTPLNFVGWCHQS